jgi:hypothetical protein
MASRIQGLLSAPPKQGASKTMQMQGDPYGMFQGGGQSQPMQRPMPQQSQGQPQRVSPGVYRNPDGSLQRGQGQQQFHAQQTMHPMQQFNNLMQGGFERPGKMPQQFGQLNNSMPGGYGNTPPMQRPQMPSSGADGKPYAVGGGFMGGSVMSDGSFQNGQGQNVNQMGRPSLYQNQMPGQQQMMFGRNPGQMQNPNGGQVQQLQQQPMNPQQYGDPRYFRRG